MVLLLFLFSKFSFLLLHYNLLINTFFFLIFADIKYRLKNKQLPKKKMQTFIKQNKRVNKKNTHTHN
jgi:hypothetical protein